MSRYSCEHCHKIKFKTYHCEDHAHTIKGTTCYAENVCGHTHTLGCCTESKDAHSHNYDIETGPAIPLECGGHCHYIVDETDYCYGHNHDICIEITDKKTDLC